MRSRTVEQEMQRRARMRQGSALHEGGNHAEGPTVVATLTGQAIDFLKPAVNAVRFDDIAVGLANHSRFFGQTVNRYSVAEHSILVLDIFDALYPGAWIDDRRAALMHDAHEFVLTDIGSPLKKAIDELVTQMQVETIKRYCRVVGVEFMESMAVACVAQRGVVGMLDDLLEPVVFEALGIPLPSRTLQEQIKRCDLRARFCEGKVLCPGETTWEGPDSELPPGVRCEYGLSTERAESQFRAAWLSLMD